MMGESEKEKEFALEFMMDHDALQEGCQSNTPTDCQVCEYAKQENCFKVKLAHCLYRLGYRKIKRRKSHD